MTVITVKAERNYPVTLTNSWTIELQRSFADRTRVAVIVSESYSPDLTELRDSDSELQVFQFRMGRMARPSPLLLNCGIGLGQRGLRVQI